MRLTVTESEGDPLLVLLFFFLFLSLSLLKKGKNWTGLPPCIQQRVHVRTGRGNILCQEKKKKKKKIKK